MGFCPRQGSPCRKYTQPEKIFSACAGAAIYRRAIFEQIGIFDERHFCYLEDVDIGYRARIYGYDNLYEPRAVVYHAGSASSGAVHNPFKEEMTAGNNMYLLYKNMPKAQLALNMPAILLGRTIKKHYFEKKGLGVAYNKGIERGRALRTRAETEQAMRELGVTERESIAEEAVLSSIPENLEKCNPLYLGGKVPFQASHLPSYAKIQLELWKNCLKRLGS